MPCQIQGNERGCLSTYQTKQLHASKRGEDSRGTDTATVLILTGIGIGGGYSELPSKKCCDEYDLGHRRLSLLNGERLRERIPEFRS